MYWPMTSVGSPSWSLTSLSTIAFFPGAHAASLYLSSGSAVA